MQEGFRPATAPGFITDFSLTFARETAAVAVGIKGELDCATAPILEERLLDLLSDQGNLSVVLDLSDMTFVDSSGLSVFISAHRHLNERGGRLSLRRPSASTLKVLEISGLNRILSIADF